MRVDHGGQFGDPLYVVAQQTLHGLTAIRAQHHPERQGPEWPAELHAVVHVVEGHVVESVAPRVADVAAQVLRYEAEGLAQHVRAAAVQQAAAHRRE